MCIAQTGLLSPAYARERRSKNVFVLLKSSKVLNLLQKKKKITARPSPRGVMIINASALAHIYVQEGRLRRRGGADVQWGHRYILYERSDKGGAYTRVLWYNTEYKKQSLVYIMIGNYFNFIDSPRRKSFIPFLCDLLRTKKLLGHTIL